MRFFAALAFFAAGTSAASLPAPIDLRVEYMPAPALGITELTPRFSFAIDSSKAFGSGGLPRGTKLTAYKITVMDAGEYLARSVVIVAHMIHWETPTCSNERDCVGVWRGQSGQELRYRVWQWPTARC